MERERRREVPAAGPSRRTDRPPTVVERDVEVEVQVVHQTEPEGQSEEKSRLLDGVSLEVQEAWICEDMMFVLQVCCLSALQG